MIDDETPASRLAGESSPFLQHGSTQPVDWWPWGEAAFREAERSDRPVLLDIGAVWCHWCHVMDRESYEHEATAALINELFVPVKVDRDDRPDVDARYQRAVQVLTGQGGWPLTAFLTPAGDVFHGGTYFPPIDAHGRPSFRRVLTEVARVWREERSRAVGAADGVAARVDSYTKSEARPGSYGPELVDTAIDELAGVYDFRNGGFGRAPKFPNAGGLDLMLDRFLDRADDWARRVVTETISAMAQGGIFDQLGGGFHRYSTDERWIIPHFEKMAYDNGPLMRTFAAAAAALDLPTAALAVERIVEHYRDIAPDVIEAGGFPASQDADFGHDNDGDYWTWTIEEIREALNDDGLMKVATLAFGLDDDAGRMHIDRSRHVLFRKHDDGVVADRLGMPVVEATAAIERARTILKAERDRRPAPFIDETLYAGWVALVASGHLAAARYLGNAQAQSAGLRALDRVWTEALVDGLGVVHRLGDVASGTVLEDQAFVLDAMLDAFELTQNAQWLERSAILMEVLLARFRDTASGAFRDRPADGAEIRQLETPMISIADAPTPSGNGTAALALLRFAEVSGSATAREVALSVLSAFAASSPAALGSAAAYIKAVAWATLPVTTVVIIDDVPSPDQSELFAVALKTFRPRTTVRLIAPEAARDAALPPAIRAMLAGESGRAYVCAGTTCAAPVADAAALGELLRTFRG